MGELEPILENSQRDEEVGLDMERRIKHILIMDDKDEFVRFMKTHLAKEKPDDSNSILSPSQLLVWICCYHSKNCACAFLKGETGQSVDLNVPLQDGLLPLHHAAKSFSYDLTLLFFQFGAQSDLRCNEFGHKFYGLLPLEAAVESLSYLIKWTPRQSIFELVITFCLPQLRAPRDTIRLLAGLTKGIEEVIYHYAEEGKLIKLAALLMVAQNKISPPIWSLTYYFRTLKQPMSLRDCVSAEIVSLINEESRLMGSGTDLWVQMCKDRKRVMMSVRLLLEIYGRAYYKITGYVGLSNYHVASEDLVARDVSCLLKDLGFTLTENDACDLINKCLVTQSEWEQLDDAAKLGECRSLPKDLRSLFYMQPRSLTNTRPMTRMPVQQNRSISTYSLHKQPGLSYAVQSFHTLRSFKDNFGLPKLCTTTEAQVKKTTKAIDRHVPNFLSSKKLSVLALAIKRGMRHI